YGRKRHSMIQSGWLQKKRKVCFMLLGHVHLMDLSGPAQVFYEASNIGSSAYELIYCSNSREVISEQGLTFAGMLLPDEVELTAGDFIFIPGIDFKSFSEGKLRADVRLIAPWLKTHLQRGIQIASVCSGALVLAEAGLLNGRKCTSHWKCIDYIKSNYPNATVLTDRLYVQDDNIFTSAGMTSGIDMSLSIIENQQGPVLAAKVAREIVVYLRRNNYDSQQTIYLDYRTHFNPAIHKVQDYIISNPGKNPGLEELAAISSTSVRSLTRLFKKCTGHTIIEFKNAVKVELAGRLVHNSDFTLEKIASLCGFESARHFRRIWTQHMGTTLSSYRNS
ncbi:MAG TPA: DJ-1/PfpI family protein, partial [Cyclobacteriaceae bacterium]|nr:DJ-1/PfpI family protein [Cyclobacteriaceae bacterium]